ncbi:hypothetical protein GCM10009808_03010 [Microbacterium sediminicola]|uniref:Helix-turn-helix domain-containing protein n=1 Tax=Microbacterium sediminicola TaxID=415210 RepID=A0ABP4TK48_9MICO
MLPTPLPAGHLLTPAQVADVLSLDVDDVISLVLSGRLRGARVGMRAQWRIEQASVAEYLDDQVEEARRMALWQQSQTASFPELWGSGAVRHAD